MARLDMCPHTIHIHVLIKNDSLQICWEHRTDILTKQLTIPWHLHPGKAPKLNKGHHHRCNRDSTLRISCLLP